MRDMTSRWRLVRVAALVAAIGLLGAACGSEEEGSGGSDGGGSSKGDCPVGALANVTEPVRLDMWYGFVGLPSEALETMAAKYNDSQDKVIVSVANQGNYDEQISKYRQSLGNADSLPNLMAAEDTNTQFLVDSKSVVAAEDCLDADPDAADIFDDLNPAIRSAYSVDDRLVPGGFGISTPVLYFNRAHFETAGLDPDAPPATLDELRSAAEALKAANIGGLKEPLVLKMDSWFWEHWLTAQGIDQVNEDNGRSAPATEPLLRSPESMEIFEWLQAMISDELLKPVKSNDDISGFLAVGTQASSMLIETSAATNTIDLAIDGKLTDKVLKLPAGIDPSSIKLSNLQADVGALPTPEGATGGQIGGNAWYIVKKSPEEIAAAWDFLKFANQTENQVEWTRTGGYLPSHTKAADELTADTEFTSSRVGKWQTVAAGSVANLNPDFTGPLIGNYAAHRSEMRALMDGLGQGSDVETLISEAEKAIAEAFAIYNQSPGQ